MLTPKSPQQYEFETVYINELVPEDHLVRLIDMAIDFEFIRDEVAHLYCQNNGRPAVDPVRFFKILFLGYLEDDKDMVEDLVAAAFNDAARRVAETSKEKMSDVTGGMPLPPGMKMPF